MVRKLTTPFVVLAVLCCSAVVQAQGDTIYVENPDGNSDPVVNDQGGNTVYAARRLTLSAGTLRVDIAPPDRALLNLGQGFAIRKFDGLDDTFVDLSIGAAYGIIENLEVGAVVLPLAFAPSGRDTFGNPQLYGRYQFLDGDIQVGGQLALLFPVVDGSDFGITLGVPVKFQLSDTMHLNTGVSIPIVFADDAVVAVSIPVEFAVNVLPALFIGANTGFGTNLTPNGFDPAIIPLGVFAGYTLGLSQTMALDLQAGFNWFNFLGFGDSRGDAVDAGTFRVTIGATLYADIAG